jgi:diguanylate cyclase (GGDEF)-like protein
MSRRCCVVARIGGDEFGLLLDPLDESAAQAKAAALLATARATPLHYAGQVITVGLSLGITMIAASETVETLLARADAHMYAAKTAQRSER